MTTPPEFVSLAVRGTTQQSEQGDYQSADMMLRLYGIHSFQIRGGFIPSYDNQALSTAQLSETVFCVRQENLKYFHFILNEHPQMLEEWVQVICEIERKLPDEYIPYLLDLGCQQKHLQKWLKLIMSDRVLWLLKQEHVANWKWYLDCDVESLEDVLNQKNKDNRLAIYRISASLAPEGLNTRNHSALSLLRNFAPMWTEQIARLLLKVMFISNVTASYDEDSILIVVIRKAAYHLPLQFVEEFLSDLRTGILQWHHLADELEITFAMRQEMLDSIRESAS